MQIKEGVKIPHCTILKLEGPFLLALIIDNRNKHIIDCHLLKIEDFDGAFANLHFSCGFYARLFISLLEFLDN
jgi:hypothetical protein